VRRGLERRRNDQKHGGSRSLELFPEPATTIATTHSPLLQAENQTQPACMPLSLSME